MEFGRFWAEYIAPCGIKTENFNEKQQARFGCKACGALLSVHLDACPHCNAPANWEERDSAL